MKERHSFPAFGNLKDTAKHEAGHFLLNWLLEREPGALLVMEGGGATIDAFPQNEYPHQRMLRMLAGIVFSDDFDALDKLVEHCSVPSMFDPLSDSYWVSKTALELAKHWHMPIDDILAGFTIVLDELRLEFGVAAGEIAQELVERKTIPQPDCEALYRQLDAQFGMDKRPPKSDIVCRIIAKNFEWEVSEGMVMGWDFKQLQEDSSN